MAKAVDQAVQLQLWQFLAELHFKVSAERRELAVPGIGRIQHVSGEVLFTEEDVKQRRMESNLQNLQRTSVMHTAKVFTLGGSFSQPEWLLFRPLTGPSSINKTSWRGRGAGAPGRVPYKGRGSGWKGSSWKGAKGFGKGTKGVVPCASGHGGRQAVTGHEGNQDHGG